MSVMGNVWISQMFVDEIVSDIEMYEPLETGGAFFGYIAENGDVVITDLIEAGPNAKRGRYCFLPDQDYQLTKMAILFESTMGRTTYLGDWHSHPDATPALSKRDERTLLEIALTKESKCPNPLMMVIGTKPKKWSVNCVKFSTGRKLLWPFFSCEYVTINLIID